MKAFLAGLLALGYSSGAFAAPDCFTKDGAEIGENAAGETVRDGNFLVTVDAHAISKENLLVVMDKINFGNLSADSFPQIFEDRLILATKANAGTVPDKQVDRPKLITQVNAQVDELAAIPGVRGVSCNGIARPQHAYPL